MFETSGQFYIFTACFAFGVIFGIFYVFLLVIKGKINNKYIKITIDLSFFILLALLFSVFTKIHRFPSVRFYMPTAVVLGLFCAIKTFNIILAKILKKLYNKYNKYLRKNYERR